VALAPATILPSAATPVKRKYYARIRRAIADAIRVSIGAGSRVETHAVAARCADDLVHPRNRFRHPACFEPKYYRVGSPGELSSRPGIGLSDRHVFDL